VAFSFGDGTTPENLVAELDWPRRLVCFRFENSDQSENLQPPLCEIPLSQLLMLREYLGEEVSQYLGENDGGGIATSFTD